MAGETPKQEVYAYSLARLLALLFVGALRNNTAIRIASLVTLILTAGKVFLYDARNSRGLCASCHSGAWTFAIGHQLVLHAPRVRSSGRQRGRGRKALTVGIEPAELADLGTKIAFTRVPDASEFEE